MTSKTIIKLKCNPDGFGQTPDELTSDMFTSDLPRQHSHDYFEDDETGLYVGVWDTTDMIESAGPYACDEFMFLLEGEAAIRNCTSGEFETARAGQFFVIPRGYNCQWHQAGNLRKFYVIYESPDEPAPDIPAVEGIIIPDPDTFGQPPPAEDTLPIFGDAPNARQQIFYRNGPGSFIVGTWNGGSFDSTTPSLPCHLFACVTAGSLTVSDPSGNHFEFRAGEALFIPQGLACQAQSDENLALIFCRVRATTAAS
jgi:uncharacterized cupin superfamily protein